MYFKVFLKILALDMISKMNENQSTANYSCALFGIISIWFITFLLHSGN